MAPATWVSMRCSLAGALLSAVVGAAPAPAAGANEPPSQLPPPARRGGQQPGPPARTVPEQDKFQNHIKAYLPPEDWEAYVGKWAGRGSDFHKYMDSYGGSYSDYTKYTQRYGGPVADYDKYVTLYASMAGQHPASGTDWQDKQRQQVAAWNKSMDETYSEHIPKDYQSLPERYTASRASSGGFGAQVMAGAAPKPSQFSAAGAAPSPGFGSSAPGANYADFMASAPQGQNPAVPGAGQGGTLDYKMYYQKYAGPGQSSGTGAGQGSMPDFQNYDKHYVGGQGWGAASDHQQYMKQYASGLGEGAVQDFQQYYKQYVGGQGQRAAPNDHARAPTVSAAVAKENHPDIDSHTGPNRIPMRGASAPVVLPVSQGTATPEGNHLDDLRRRAEQSVERVEQFANSLKYLLNVDQLAAEPAQKANETVAKQRKALEDELHALQQSAASNETALPNANETINRVKEEIANLQGHEEEILRRETRRVQENAARAARGAQDAARHAAREARKETDHYARAAHDSRADADLADKLARRAEAAADKAERAGEELSRHLEDALRTHLDLALARLRTQMQAHQKSLAQIAQLALARQAGQKQFLAQRTTPSAAPTYAGAFAAIACLAAMAVAFLMRHSSLRRPIQPPDTLLG